MLALQSGKLTTGCSFARPAVATGGRPRILFGEGAEGNVGRDETTRRPGSRRSAQPQGHPHGRAVHLP